MPPFLRRWNDYEKPRGSYVSSSIFSSFHRSFTLQSDFFSCPCQAALSDMVCARHGKVPVIFLRRDRTWNRVLADASSTIPMPLLLQGGTTYRIHKLDTPLCDDRVLLFKSTTRSSNDSKLSAFSPETYSRGSNASCELTDLTEAVAIMIIISSHITVRAASRDKPPSANRQS